MLVPEAAVEEDRRLSPGKRDIGSTENARQMLPESIAGGVERASYGNLK